MQQHPSGLCDASPSKRVAIIGAGPIGIELALSALQRGMTVALFESGEAVGAQVLLWKHVTLFSPWSMNTSDAGWRVLCEAGHHAPPCDAYPTGAEFVARYLEPLSHYIRSHARCSALHLHARVLSVGRGSLLKGESIGGGDVLRPQGKPHARHARALTPFRLLVSHGGSDERYHDGFDFVCDCSGCYRCPASPLLPAPYRSSSPAAHPCLTRCAAGASRPTGAGPAACQRWASATCGHVR
jgi:hypothetical protein